MANNTVGEKELRTDWDELTASDETKRVGHQKNLIPEEADLTPLEYRKGL